MKPSYIYDTLLSLALIIVCILLIISAVNHDQQLHNIAVYVMFGNLVFWQFSRIISMFVPSQE